VGAGCSVGVGACEAVIGSWWCVICGGGWTRRVAGWQVEGGAIVQGRPFEGALVECGVKCRGHRSTRGDVGGNRWAGEKVAAMSRGFVGDGESGGWRLCSAVGGAEG